VRELTSHLLLFATQRPLARSIRRYFRPRGALLIHMPPPAFHWARLRVDTPLPLRRGAWYRILKLTSMEAMLNVKGTPLPVPRGQLELAAEPLLRWTVVAAPRGAPRFPTNWGHQYAVCPSCRERAPLLDQPTAMRCQRCNGLFDVAWDEHYLTNAQPGA